MDVGQVDLGEEVVPREIVRVQLRQPPGLGHAWHVDRIDDEDVPIARLGLLEDPEADARSLVVLDVHRDAVGLLERAEQLGIGVIAPHQGVQFGRSCVRAASPSSVTAAAGDPRRGP